MKDILREVKLEGVNYTFILHPLVSPLRKKYFISASDKTDQFHFEIEEQSGGRWKVVQPAPSWATALESSFAEILRGKFN